MNGASQLIWEWIQWTFDILVVLWILVHMRDRRRR